MIIGASLARIDGFDKSRGRTKYAIDLKLTNMLYGKLLRSALPHARVLNIDISRAKRATGVKAIITYEDCPDKPFGTMVKDQTIFPVGKVRYVGEPIAAVAASDEDSAEEALDLIKVDYEELPAVYDPLLAMEASAPILHERIAEYAANFKAIKYGNVCTHSRIRVGSPEGALAGAHRVYEDRFTTQMVHQAPLETHVALAVAEPQGRLTVWTSSQQAFVCREMLAEALQIPINKVRVVVPPIGGGFGAKMLILIEPFAALLSAKAARPVKIALTREEEFIGGTPRHPCIIEMKTAVSRDGELLARKSRFIFDTGAYSHYGPVVACIGAMSSRGPYRIKDIEAEGLCVYTNKVTAGAFRGVGMPQAAWASETQLDIIAADLGLDPLELRLKNAVEDGDEHITGQIIRAAGIKEVLNAVSQKTSWHRKMRNDERKIGFGLASMQAVSGKLSTGAFVRLNEDGSAMLSVGTVEIGTGATTILSQMLAESLGVNFDDILVIHSDTDATPYDWGTIASRTTFDVGNAVKLAAEDARRQLFELASAELEISAEDLEAKPGFVYARGAPGRKISIAELSRLGHLRKGGPILGRAKYISTGEMDWSRLEGYALGPYGSFTYAAQVAKVEVDAETGLVSVLNITSAHDVGRAINPRLLEGQIEGALAQGIGYALFEDTHFQGGAIKNPCFTDYKILTPLEVNNSGFTPVIVEKYEPAGPFGARGMAEPPMVATAPAIGNAVFNATGARIKDLPITPEKLLTEIKRSSKQS